MVENKPNALEIRNVKFATILVILLAVSMMLAAALPDAASGLKDVANAKITSLVLSEMAQAGFGDKIPVIVIMHEQPSTPVKRGVLPEQLMSMKSLAGTSQQDIVQMLRMEGSSSVGRIEQLWLVNAVSVEASPATIMKMAQRDDVARIEPDLEVNAIDSDNDQFSPSLFDKLLNKDPMISPPKDKVKPTDIIRDYPSTYEDIAWGVEWIEAPALWARGINGSGINVSIIDTGINAQHPDLQGKVVAWKDFTKNIPFSGTSAWYSGKGDNLTNTLTRTFDLSGVSSATLEFEGCYELEYGYNSTTEEYIYYDAGYVNVSTDSGVTWDTIEVYQGQSDGYMHEELDLTPYIGNSSVMVRFAYVTDGSYHWEGWYIDDITIPETGYFDGAESGIGDWTTDGWEIKDNTVYWPNGNAWYSGAGNDLYNTLEQSFNLSGVNGATLNFTTRYDMEGGCDYGYVRASTGSGWTTLATYNGYSDWTDESIDLSSYAGYNVTIRFLYDTDDSVSYEGWFIDNIGISEIPFSDDVESGEGGWTADGWYIVGPDTPYDDQGHGTHVAGTVAGTGADWLKTGVAPGANLMGAKVLDNWGSGSMSDVIRGVEWSVENGADVVSLSLGMNPIDGGDGYGDLNESETAVENITVFTNPFVDTPFKTDTPTAYQPTYIIGLVGFREDTCVWEADGYSISTLTRTFNLTDITSATLEFGTAYEECYGNSIGEVQASTDGVTWETLVDYSGNSYEWLEGSRWINESISLDDYTGDNVTLRFLFDPYYDGYWQIDNIAIPKMGFYDNVETGNSGWTASGWYIDDTWRAVDITNADISLNAPDGTAVSGDEMDWLFEGVVPENLWIYKYTPAVPLQAGEWNLTVTSNFNGTLDYCAELVVGYPTDGTDAASQALDTAAGLGVVPVVAAGNDGELGLHTIGSPGASGSAITVGATDCYMDYIARFSSRGPVGFDTSEIIKPDVVAPGTDIGSTYYLGDYAWMSGTSMATPHVAGATALLLQADPSLTPAQVKQTLMDTSVDLGESGKDNSYGAGRISAYAAVNATVDLPEPVSERPDQYELFAGATVDEIYLPPFIRDTVGDADDYADITNVGVSSDDTQLGIYIYTEGAPDLTLAGFRFGMDTDRNTSTGNNADIPELGRDYGVRINDTGYYLYRWDANVNDRVWIQNIDGWVSDDCVYFSIPFSAINETQSSVRMNAVAGSFTPDGTLLDEAPDAGYGTYPWLDVTIDMVGISWNDRTGLPEQGMNITFDVKQYRSYPYYDYITIASITNTTNSQGMATAVVHVNQTDDWEQYHVYISDEYGNEIDDYVYADADYSFLYERPFFIPSWRDYHAAMNSTLSVKLTMVTQDWEPYNENVTLVFGDRWDSRGNVSVELTPVNGTIEYDLDLSTTDIDENYLDSWYYDLPIQILNGTLEDYDCAEFVGYLYIYDDEWYNLELSPEMAGASAGSNISYLVETYISNMSTDRPVSDGLTVEVVWIDEVEVKKLGVQPSILGKLDRMRAQMEDTGRNDNLLTGDEQQKLVEALNGLEPQNIGINYTAFDITTDTNGLDQFDVDVPLDAYMGFVWIDGETDGHWYYDESIVFVFENFDWYHHPSAPHPEIVDYDLDIYAHWDSTTVDGIIIPDNNITVEIWLEQYDPQLDDWDDVPYEDVYLYTTTSDTKRVTTDADGYACVNFTAPSLDVLNSSWAERRVQVWGITSLLTPYGKIAVAEDDWAHLRIHFNHSRPTLEINNNNLDVTLEFKDETWTDTTNVPTVLDVVKSYTDYWWWSSTKDIMSAYINSPTSVWQTFIPLTEYGTYSVYSSVDYPSPGYNSWCVWIDQISFTPFDIGSDIQYEYPRNTEQPITVTVLDLQGQPVEGASVYIVEQDFWYDDDHYSESSVAGSGGGSSAAGSGGGSSAGWNHIDLATTNSEGTATLTLKTPDHDTELWYRIGGATSEFMFPYVESGLFQVTEPSNQPNLRASINMPSVIEAGVGTSITGKVYNYGYVPSNASVLRLYVNDVSLTDITIDVIQPDEYTDFSQQWTPTSSGTYQIKAEADATDTNDESNENDNINIKSVTASLPDLVSAITMPAVTQPGTTVDISVTVSNTGGIDAGASSLLITVNDTAYNTSSVPAIAAHGSAIVRVPWTPAVEGDYWINVTADSGSVISELSETNNGASMLVAVINQTTMSITSFSLGVGSNVTVPVMVNNANEVAGGSVNITFDQSVVNVQDITGGNFGLATVNINNSNGYVYIAVSRATAVGIRGAVLANVTFAGISAGSTALDLTQAKVNDEIGNITIVPVSNGTVTVYQWPLGDLNHNYRLDTGDATLALRMVVKLIPEDLLGDMNANGGIDTGDATLILRKVVGFD